MDFFYIPLFTVDRGLWTVDFPPYICPTKNSDLL
jgi:hypothetical protein